MFITSLLSFAHMSMHMFLPLLIYDHFYPGDLKTLSVAFFILFRLILLTYLWLIVSILSLPNAAVMYFLGKNTIFTDQAYILNSLPSPGVSKFPALPTNTCCFAIFLSHKLPSQANSNHILILLVTGQNSSHKEEGKH